MTKPEIAKGLSDLADLLEAMSKASRRSHGWTYDDEVKVLRAAVDALAPLVIVGQGQAYTRP